MLPDDEALKAAEKAGSVRSMARKGSWGGREGLSTVGVSWGSGGVGGVHVSVKNTHGSLVAVMFKANEKRASKGIDAASTAERLKPAEDQKP